MNDARPLLTVHDVARRLSFDPSTVRLMIQRKIIRGVKLCGRWRVPASEIDRLIVDASSSSSSSSSRRQTRRRSARVQAAMAKIGLPPHYGAFAPEAGGKREPSSYRCAPIDPRE